MIIGECPYCDSTITNAMPEQSPAISPFDCESCDNTYWLVASRIQSIAYTEDDFFERYKVDHVNKTVEEKQDAN